MISFFLKSKENKKKTQIREFLKKIVYLYEEEKNKFSNSHFTDTYSLVILLNEDFPLSTQLLSVVECSSEFLSLVGNSQDVHIWKDRRKLVGKKDHIILYLVGAEEMQSLYKDYYMLFINGEKHKSLIKTISTLQVNGTIYPVAMCLGFLWTKDIKEFNIKYQSIRM